MSIYLDYNASTPVDKRVLDVMIDVYTNSYGNADSRTHDYGESARSIVETARGQIAELISVKNDEVFFTSGATESNNIAILGLQDYAQHSGKHHIVTTEIEHKSVLEPIRFLQQKGFEVTYIKPGVDGRVSVPDVLDAVRDDTLLVSVMHVNNETGIIQPVKEIGTILAEKSVLFHIDAVQSCGKLIDELREVKYDMLSISAHKMSGPQGVGALILRKKRYKLPPVSSITYGGKQEHGIRPGTIPTALVAGFGEAARIAICEHDISQHKCTQIRQSIIKKLEMSGLDYTINGNDEYCIPSTLNVSFAGVNSEALMLATRQYCSISNGSACNSNSYELSYVLKAMGLEDDSIRSSVRLSWGYDGFDEQQFDEMLHIISTLA